MKRERSAEERVTLSESFREESSLNTSGTSLLSLAVTSGCATVKTFAPVSERSATHTLDRRQRERNRVIRRPFTCFDEIRQLRQAREVQGTAVRRLLKLEFLLQRAEGAAAERERRRARHLIRNTSDIPLTLILTQRPPLASTHTHRVTHTHTQIQQTELLSTSDS